MTAAAMLGAFGGASSASASASAGYISGVDAVTDDWGDEGTLSTTSYANSGAVGLWQKVLVADGLMSTVDVDCSFGPKTLAATKTWQSRNGLTADGKVGPATFGKADNRLTDQGNGYVYYNGSNGVAAFKRANGRYSALFYNSNDTWSVVYYSSKPSWC
ncbi:peptidoglycan-binding protein [Micromonospora chalcea]|uniref:peptidoglycan-binding domain-containing protein n=1 Tax=Micromonospora TaxID=1873 RepID=UPI001408A750|nr:MULTISPECIES: peptidoglycan-binding domain-containing protein [Micromonospora]MCT2279363.1 peptidoglycan-binding protein [Micromonospora chalcea]NHO81597.1 peptidoglycan-binding protein [Micromonospora sp. CMU55-4]